MTDKQAIINAIKSLAAENGGIPPGQVVFSRETGISQHHWKGGFWTRWSDAIAEAGFAPNTPSEPFGPSAVVTSLVKAARRFGRFPIDAELRLLKRQDDTVPHMTTIRQYFPSKSDRVEAVRAFCRASS